MRKSNAGFTLVELIVSIAASALVIGAAISFMIFGMRMDNAASETASVQSDSRIIMRVLENIAAEMSVAEIKTTEFSEENHVVWELYVSDDTGMEPYCVLSFNKALKTINGKDDVVIIEDIEDSVLSYENRVLKCEILTDSGEKYESSVYCRVGTGEILLAKINAEVEEEQVDEALKAVEASPEEMAAREKFIETIFEQYGSTGRIYDNTIFNGYEFATWYWAMNLRNESEIWIDTPEEVPWCAIFVSWALNKTVENMRGTTITDGNGNTIVLQDKAMPQNIDALVDNVMWYQFGRKPACVADDEIADTLALDFENDLKFMYDPVGYRTSEYNKIIANGAYTKLGEWYYPEQEIVEEDIFGQIVETKTFTPQPGDIVFFENKSENFRSDHLGVALYIETVVEDEVKTQYLYVAEGNHNDSVGIFKYKLMEVEIEGIVETETGAQKSTQSVYTFTDGVSHVIGYGVIEWDNLIKRVSN